MQLRKKNRVIHNDDLLKNEEEEDLDIDKFLLEEQWKLFEEKLDCLSENCAELLKAHFSKVPYKTIVEKYNYLNENTAFQRVFKCKKALIKLIKTDPRFHDLMD